MKKIISAFVAIICALHVHAQAQETSFVTTDLQLPAQPLRGCSFNGSMVECDSATASFKWICFDDGQRTAIISMDWPWFLTQYQEGKPHVKKLNFSYSGKNLHLVKSLDMYAIMRGKTMCGAFGRINNNGKKVWIAAVNFGEECHVIDDIYLGMNLDELKDLTSRTLKNSSVKFLYNEGGNKVYDVLWLGMRDTYKDFSGTQHTEVHATESYGRFWFDANGKLVKWYSWSEGSNL